MDRLKKSRAPVRASFTRTVSELKGQLADPNPNQTVLEAKVKKLEATWQELQGLDSQIKEAMLDAECNGNEILEERESVDKYSDEWFAITVSVRNSRTESRPNSPTLSNCINESSEATHKRRSFRLPKIELKKFNGEFTDWLGWWSQFTKIHEDEELDDSDKFQYLIQAMSVGSRARELVESYPQTAANYPKVILALKDRFGKDKLLRQVYVRELLRMVMQNTKSRERMSLSKMFDKLESHLRSLESLGVTADQMTEFLFPMVESSLPEDVLVAWQRSAVYGRDGSRQDPAKTELDFLMDFLRQEVESESQRTLAKAGFESMSKEKKETKQRVVRDLDEIPTAAGLFSGQTQTCCFCGKGHSSQDCFKAHTMTLTEKKNKLKEKRCCFGCLRSGHVAKVCKASVRCVVCSKKHPSLMCPDLPSHKSTESKDVVVERSVSMTNQVGFLDAPLQTLLVRIVSHNGRKKRIARLVFDNGSQGTSVLSSCVKKLELRPLSEVWIRRSLYGGTVTDLKRHSQYRLCLESLNGEVRRTLLATDEEKICGDIDRVPKGPWLRELSRKKIWLADLGSENPEIEVLVGNDYYGQLLTGRIESLSCGLTAIETVFGWVLSGKFPNRGRDSKAMLVVSMWANEAVPSELWGLETLGIRDPFEHKTRSENELMAKQHFMETVSRDDDGRYCVSLPWIDKSQAIPNNRLVAGKRLESMTNKLISSGKYEDYDEVFNEWLEEGIVEEVLESEIQNPSHYLPHRAVYKPQSLSTPVRPVFDASCKVRREPSLNDCLEKGPNLIEDIPAVLLRFRKGRIGVISDIRKAFLQIGIRREDRDFLRFLWWSDLKEKTIKVFRHNRVVFGVNCSPYLLGAVIEHHLTNIGLKGSVEIGKIANQLLKSLYVDNCVTSVDSLEELRQFKGYSIEIMAEAKMELRQWEWSYDEVGMGQSKESLCSLTTVLGMKWDKTGDSLMCDMEEIALGVVTKRSVLSSVQRIFDPMGFFCPALLMPKLLLQESWSEKSSWDDEFEVTKRERFENWCHELVHLKAIKIPRNMTGQINNDANWQIHMFCDASACAYAAAVFLRAEDNGVVSVQLIRAKSRVAPLKKTSIPRLELLSCTIGARLVASVKEALNSKIQTFYWSDSTTALAWMNRNDEWGTFVGNRVKEICKLTTTSEWRHIPGTLNPADLPSRGCSPRRLAESRWWEGPEWLKRPSSEWPSGGVDVDEEEVMLERKKRLIATHMMTVEKETPWYIRRFSTYLKNVRVVSWMRRFIQKSRKKNQEFGELSVLEVEQAEIFLFGKVQKETFSDGVKTVNGIWVERDDQGLIRVKTKLIYRDDTQHFKLPILLPSSHALVEQLIRWEHDQHGHAGVQFLMGRLRERFWILQGRRAIKRVIGSCVRCRRYSAKSPITIPAPLPEGRVNDSKVFQIVGIDLAGPLFLRNKSKVWIVLNTCAVYRCVHLELVTSLSTEAFLLAFQRFIGRRGKPDTVYSDNGTNFVGTVNLFESLDWKRIEREMHVKRINWKFNPPSAAWWGGWWERLIRSVKDLLKRMLGHARLTYEELLTVICHVESLINGRPLTFVTEDADDLIPLTPKMFLQDIQDTETPEIDLLGGADLRRRYRYKQKLKEDLRARFRKEYLSQLVQRGKEKKQEPMRIGDVVLVGYDNKKRLEWPMGKILELLPGKDGEVRVVKLKTTSGILIRPIQRLFPLEVSSSLDVPRMPDGIKCASEKVEASTKAVGKTIEFNTRSGRKVKAPVKYSQ